MPSPERLPLLDAVQRWCDLDLVQAIRDEECTFLAYELDQLRDIPQLTSRHARRQPSERSWKVDTDYTRLQALWRELRNDFSRRVERSEIFLSGVQLKPELRTVAEPIPGIWAAGCQFDFLRGTMRVADRSYAGIECSRMPMVEADTALSMPQNIPSPLCPDGVAALSDEVILALLEEYAERVVAGPDAKLGPSLTFSLMPIIYRKLKQRAAAGEMLRSIAAETAWLADWIAEKAPSFHVPTAKSIENSLRHDYNRLKAQAKGIKA